MYLAILNGQYSFFLFDNPRDVGYPGAVIEGVELVGYDDDDQNERARRVGNGDDVPEQFLGVKDGFKYQIFDSRKACATAGFELLTSQFNLIHDAKRFATSACEVIGADG